MGILDRTVSTTVNFSCKPSQVYEILVDYENYFDWISFVTGSRLLAQEGDLALAEFIIRKPYSKLVVESIHSKDEMVVVRKISGDTPFREMVWQISSLGNEQCEVSLKVLTGRDLKRFLLGRPRFWRRKALLEALKSRVAQLAGGPADDLSVQKIIDVVETSEGLVLWLLGKRYLLKPLPEEKND